jgi:hypothetical protein
MRGQMAFASAREPGGEGVYFEQAIGSSQLPGTDWTTMFDSFTPEARSLALVPARRGSIIAREEEH